VNDWLIYRGTGVPGADAIRDLPPPPSWREFGGGPPVPLTADTQASTARRLGKKAAAYHASKEEVELVNAALYLRRPLLVTGKPGTGKSTLPHSVARELDLGPVLSWPVTSRSNRQEGLYAYDALARLQDASLAQQLGNMAQQPGNDGSHLGIGRYITLGPLGTALLPYERPRVLLIDELDKSDIDLPNDLLTLFEEGEYEIPELSRIAGQQKVAEVLTHDGSTVEITKGKVVCNAFPLVIITSNGERDFPPPFLRRCLRLRIPRPTPERLAEIVESHLGPEEAEAGSDLIEAFYSRQEEGDLATDQLLNAIYLSFNHAWPGDRGRLISSVMQHLNTGAGE
jgi:MoxR-like ATPase